MADVRGPARIPLAIIGMACRLPGADNLQEYWRLLVEGRSAIGELPPERLDQALYYDPRVGVRGKTYSKLGAIISSRRFDRQACPIPEQLASSVDNVHVLMCDVAGQALRHAGLDPFQLPLRNVGVYIGHAQGSNLGGDLIFSTCVEEALEFLREVPDFQRLPSHDQDQILQELVQQIRARLPRRAADSPDVSASMVAGTIAQAFGLTGPFLAINSACASSLQAMLLGARALQLGQVDMVIAGGASDCKSDSLVLFSAARAVSATGSRPFDADADGLICSEGYAAIVMKTLDRALADGDPIQAIVRGLGVSSDGKGKSLWAPRKEGQVKAMERAYEAGVEIADLQYLEAHSTATQLGDATELNTLTEILSQHFPPGKKIPVTSVKANIGHSLETAGLAGVIKVVLCMQHGMVCPAINIQRLNPGIDWDRAPIFVPTTAAPWPAPENGQPRRAGVNAFGIGGLNMHVVLDEFTPAARALARAASAEASAAEPDRQAVAIIGRGCVLPGAGNVPAYWELLASGHEPKRHVPEGRWRTDLAHLPRALEPYRSPSTLGGFITDFEYDWRRHKVPPKQVAQADPLQFMLLEAADQAIQDAGYSERPFDRSRVGVVVGTEFGGDFSFQLQLGLRLPELQRDLAELLQRRGLASAESQAIGEQYAQVLLAHWPALIDETGSFSTSSLASRISKTWNLMGGAAAIDAGEVSALAAVDIGLQMLLAGDCDLMICAAGQRRMALPQYECLAMTGLLAEGSPHSPLDARAHGYVPGEGVGVVLLKRLADAQRDGDRIHTIIRGVAAGHHSSWQDALQIAIPRSLQSAGLGARDVGFLELDALGTPQTTAEQLAALAEVYGGQGRAQPLLVSSVVGQIGNLQGGSGMASLLKASLELGHGEVPATVGLRTPVAAVAQQPELLSAVSTPSPIAPATPEGRRVGAVASCSRGLAYHVVLEQGSQMATAPVRIEVQSDAQQTPPSIASSDLEAFLIQFVVEQTGYPPEVVELDADLEADLGIDSIKKAQMFGELQEYFDVTPTEGLTLDDFPTLRHVLDFLARADAAQDHAPPAAEAAAPAPAHAAAPAPRSVSQPSAAIAPSPTQPASNPIAPTPTAWQICRLGADSLTEFEQRLTRLDAETWYASAAQNRFTHRDQLRLAIVTESPQRLATQLQTARSQWQNPAVRTVWQQQGIFFRHVRPRGARIAFLYPGQGSQYTGMLQDLIREVPAAAAALREMDQALTRLGYAPFAQLAWDDDNQLGRDVWTTQIAMLVADATVTAALRDRGIHPDLVAGHSYGEYAALLAANVWDFEQAARVTRARCEGILACAEARGGMLATSAPPEVIEQLASQTPSSVYVANQNAPDQTVAAGRWDALEALEARLKAAGHPSRRLAVPCPFHTPLMRDSTGPIEQALQSIRLRPPQVTAYSTVTNQPVGGEQQIRANLVAHLTTPVRYADLVRQLAAEQPTVFVEVGPQQALTRLNRRILGDDQADAIACDDPKRAALEQLLCVRALLECTGSLDRERHAVDLPDAAPNDSSVAPAGQTAVTSEPAQILRFDATARRRERMRTAAQQSAPLQRRSGSSGTAAAAPPPAAVSGPRPSTGPSSTPPSSRPSPVPADASATAPATADAPVPPTVSTVPSARVDLGDLESFLIRFVVEQTGYPPEVVELDAELEADLGIDSIKKAQMFGELQEYFDVTPTEGLTLDDFPTLRHVLDFLAQSGASGDEAAAAATSLAPAPFAAALPAPAATSAASPGPSVSLSSTPPPQPAMIVGTPIDSGPGWTSPVPADASATTPASANAEVPPTASTVPSARVDLGDLESFLIRFVVEQTGYPPEVVELDAELEADLGIDSIKKAQMFGELQEYFDVTPTEGLTLDDFPTLRHVLDFLAQSGASDGEAAAAATSPTPAPFAAALPAPAATSAASPGPSVSLSSTPPPQLAMIVGTPVDSGPGRTSPVPADASATAPATADAPVPPTASTEPSARVDLGDLESFLIRFVVEQTGYPPEVVELDAELEADLGIDSIKKAQMFGELQEYFDVTPTEGLTLDDFPTLRHVLNFLAQPTATPGTDLSATPETDLRSGGPQANSPDVATEPSPPPARQTGIELLQVQGTSYELGWQHGLEKKDQIRHVLRRVADLTDLCWDELPIPAQAREDARPFFDSDQWSELQGLADAVEVPVATLATFNLALFADWGAGGVQLAIRAASNPLGNMLHGVRDDIGLQVQLSECLTPLVLVRQPVGGISHATFTFAGVVGSLGGLNACGLAATAAALCDATPNVERQGQPHPLLIPALLRRAEDLPAALEYLKSAPTPGGWNLCLSHCASDRACLVEHDGQGLQSREQSDPIVVTNHMLLQPHASQRGGPSQTRLGWIEQAWRRATGGLAIAELQRWFQDPSSGSQPYMGLIMENRQGNLWVHAGGANPHEPGTYQRIHVGSLLPLPRVEATTAPAGAGSATFTPAAADPGPDDLQDSMLADSTSRRYVMRLVSVPWPDRAPDAMQLEGPVLIVGHNDVAESLRQRLLARGATVHTLQTLQDIDTTVAAVDQFWSQGAIPHLFLLSARDPDQPNREQVAAWHGVYEQRVLLPYFLCQRWLQRASAAKLLDKCTVVAVTDLGGDFGFQSEVVAPESGALTGLMKALFLEYSQVGGHRHFLSKAIDAPRSESPVALAGCIERELAAHTIDFEVAFIAGQRYLQLAVAQAAAPRPRAGIRPGANWVITGGARGITVECALELGRRFGLRLHLIGSSPAPQVDPAWRELSEAQLNDLRAETIIQARKSKEKPNEAWERVAKAIEIDRSLQRFGAEGIAATYHSCDVSDGEALAEVLREIRRVDGPIEGILHGAGIERSCRFEKKTRETVRATFGAKVQGAYHLMQLTRDDPVRHFLAFGSVSGRLGSNGQTDYCAASDLLCKLISWYRLRHPSCHAVGFHWHPWDEVGMASRSETRAALEMTNGPQPMPLRLGILHLLRELYTGSTETEVLITDQEYHQRYYGAANPEAVSIREPIRAADPAPQPPVQRIASRFRMQVVEESLPPSAGRSPAFDGDAVVLGENAAALALRERLTAQGVTVHGLPTEDDTDRLLATLDEISSSRPVRHLFLMTGRDPDASELCDQEAVHRRVHRGVWLPFLVTQRWMQHVLKQESGTPATLVAATSLGGDFGFANSVSAPEGGALTGLLKSIFVEDARFGHQRFRVKVIDSPADEDPAQLVRAICDELVAVRPEVEVAWSGGRRRVVHCVAEPIECLPRRDLRPGGCWVVTGGARGITAATACELGRRYQLKLHLVGKNPIPRPDAPWLHGSEEELKAIKKSIVRQAIAEGRSPDEDWSRVRKDQEITEWLARFAQEGVQATYHSCDVSDWTALAELLDDIRRQDGPIEGIIHGAGYAKAARVESRTTNAWWKTILPKVDGTLALMALTRSDPLKYFVGFGSLSGRFGGNGLSDYAAANEMLAKLCDWFRQQRPDCHTSCFHWQTWDEIGMAMVADAVEITRSSFQMDFIPPLEGIEHLHQELRAGLPLGEVLITDGYFQRFFYPEETGQRETSASRPQRPPRPLIEQTSRTDPDGLIAEVAFRPDLDPFLVEHRLREKPFLPGVVGIESLLEAASLCRDGCELHEIRDVVISHGLLFSNRASIPTQVTVRAEGDVLECKLTSELRDRRGRLVDGAREHVRGRVLLGGKVSALTAEPPGSPPLGWSPHHYVEDGLVYHGRPLRCLREFALQYDGAWGKIVAPPPSELAGARPAEGWLLPLAVLDGCLVACATFLFLQFGGVLEVPQAFEALRWTRQPQPGETCVVRLHFRSRQQLNSNFDFTLFAGGDEAILQAIGYRTVRVGTGGD